MLPFIFTLDKHRRQCLTPKPIPRGRSPTKLITVVRADSGLPIATAERRASDRGDWLSVNRLERAMGRRDSGHMNEVSQVKNNLKSFVIKYNEIPGNSTD